jgi:hypothetical protein
LAYPIPLPYAGYGWEKGKTSLRPICATKHRQTCLFGEVGSHRDYLVSILEIASPDMATADIVAPETFWKEKLGAHTHGLIAN